MLQAELNVAHARPAGSVTPDELADELNVTYYRASQILRGKRELTPVKYREGGRQRVCFVVKG